MQYFKYTDKMPKYINAYAKKKISISISLPIAVLLWRHLKAASNVTSLTPIGPIRIAVNAPTTAHAAFKRVECECECQQQQQ